MVRSDQNTCSEIFLPLLWGGIFGGDVWGDGLDGSGAVQKIAFRLRFEFSNISGFARFLLVHVQRLPQTGISVTSRLLQDTGQRLVWVQDCGLTGPVDLHYRFNMCS